MNLKGCLFPIKGIRRGAFSEKKKMVYKKGKGLDLGAEPPRIKLFFLSNPPPGVRSPQQRQMCYTYLKLDALYMLWEKRWASGWLGQNILLSQCLSPPSSTNGEVSGKPDEMLGMTCDGLASHPGGIAILLVS